MTDFIGLLAVFSLFVFIPSLVVGTLMAHRWFRLKDAELELRREDLALQKQKLQFLTTESQRELVERLDRL